VREHERALGGHGLAEPDAGGAMDEPRQRVAPLLERAIAKIYALEVEEVENDE